MRSSSFFSKRGSLLSHVSLQTEVTVAGGECLSEYPTFPIGLISVRKLGLKLLYTVSYVDNAPGRWKYPRRPGTARESCTLTFY